MKKVKPIFIIIILVLSMIGFSPITQSKNNAAVIYVDAGRAAGWYNATKVRTISEGINNVTAGGTIYVYDGTYTENIIINKTVTIIGNSSGTVFLRPATTPYPAKTINVRANNTNISHMNITGAAYGLYMYQHKNIKIENCSFNKTTTNQALILAEFAGEVIIANSSFYNQYTAIYSYYSINLTVTNSTISTPDYSAVSTHGRNVTITNCTVNSFSVASANSVFLRDNNITIDSNPVYIVSATISMINNIIMVDSYVLNSNYFSIDTSSNICIDNNNFSGCNLVLELNNANYIVSNNTFSYAGIDFDGSFPPSSLTMNNNTINGTQILFVQDSPSYTFENNHSAVQAFFMDVSEVTINNVSFLPTGSWIAMINTGLCDNVSISNITGTTFNNKGVHDSLYDASYHITQFVSIKDINISSTGMSTVFPIFETVGMGGNYIMDNITFELQPSDEYASLFLLGGGDGGYSNSRSYYISNVSVYNMAVFAMFEEYPLHSLYIDNVTAIEKSGIGFIGVMGRALNITIKNTVCSSYLQFFLHIEDTESTENMHIKNVTCLDIYSEDFFEGRFKNLLIEDLTYIGDEQSTFFLFNDNTSNVTIRNSNITETSGGEVGNYFMELDTWTDNVSLDNVTAMDFYYGIYADYTVLENISVNNSFLRTYGDNVMIYSNDARDLSFTNNTIRCFESTNYLLWLEGDVWFNGHALCFYIDNVTVKNNTFIGDNTYTGFYVVQNINFSHNNITQEVIDGIYISYGNNISLYSNHIACEYGFSMYDVDNITSSYNKLLYEDTGIEIYEGRNVAISNEIFLPTQTVTVGVAVEHSNYVSFSDSYIDGGNTGITICSSNKTTVNDNLMLLDIEPEAPVEGYGVYISGTCEYGGGGGEEHSHHLIYGNNITFSEGSSPSYGVYIVDEDNVTIRNNEINYANYPSVYIETSSYTYTLNNTIRGTNTVLSDEYGIVIKGDPPIPETHHVVGFNNITRTNYGVYISGENDVLIRDNFLDGIYAGIDVSSTCNINITRNQIKNSYYGIYLEVSNTGIIDLNFITGNHIGIFLIDESGYFLIYNNYFDNTYNACENNLIATSTWNITKTAGTNIVGGPYLMGNYWSDYGGVDVDGDGIGDTPYEVEPCIL